MTSTMQGVVSSEGNIHKQQVCNTISCCDKCTLMTGNGGDTAGDNRVQSK